MACNGEGAGVSRTCKGIEDGEFEVDGEDDHASFASVEASMDGDLGGDEKNGEGVCNDILADGEGVFMEKEGVVCSVKLDEGDCVFNTFSFVENTAEDGVSADGELDGAWRDE